MNLLEKDYFGLIYEDKYDSRSWLDLERRISKFLKSQFFMISNHFQKQLVPIIVIIIDSYFCRRALEISL